MADTTTEAPATTSPAPATTSPAPVTTADPSAVTKPTVEQTTIPPSTIPASGPGTLRIVVTGIRGGVVNFNLECGARLNKIRAYALQETVDPLKKLGSYLAWGAGGSAVMSLGVFFLALSALRALQTETGDTFVGEFSWVPYLIVAVALCGLLALAVRRIVHYQHSEHRKPA